MIIKRFYVAVVLGVILSMVGAGSASAQQSSVDAGFLKEVSHKCAAGSCTVEIADNSFNPNGVTYTWQLDFHNERRPGGFVAECDAPPCGAMAPGSTLSYTYRQASDEGFHNLLMVVTASDGTSTSSNSVDVGSAEDAPAPITTDLPPVITNGSRFTVVSPKSQYNAFWSIGSQSSVSAQLIKTELRGGLYYRTFEARGLAYGKGAFIIRAWSKDEGQADRRDIEVTVVPPSFAIRLSQFRKKQRSSCTYGTTLSVRARKAATARVAVRLEGKLPGRGWKTLARSRGARTLTTGGRLLVEGRLRVRPTRGTVAVYLANRNARFRYVRESATVRAEGRIRYQAKPARFAIPRRKFLGCRYGTPPKTVRVNLI